jgi:hypothetical protein
MAHPLALRTSSSGLAGAVLTIVLRGGCCTNRFKNRGINQSGDNSDQISREGVNRWDGPAMRVPDFASSPTAARAPIFGAFVQQPPRVAQATSADARRFLIGRSRYAREVPAGETLTPSGTP